MKAKFTALVFLIGMAITATVMSVQGQTALAQEAGVQPGQFWGRNDFQPHPMGADFSWHGSSSPAEQQLAHQANELTQKFREAKSEDDREKIRAGLTDTLNKQFDLRQKRHMTEIENLEAQLKRLKELVQKRQEARRDIINKRVDQLQREAEGLGW